MSVYVIVQIMLLIILIRIIHKLYVCVRVNVSKIHVRIYIKKRFNIKTIEKFFTLFLIKVSFMEE